MTAARPSAATAAPLLAWLPRIHDEYLALETTPRFVWAQHLPLMAVVAAVLWIPAVQSFTGVDPVLAVPIIGINAALNVANVHLPVCRRAPVFWSTAVMLYNAFAAVGLAALSGRPHSLLWGFLALYVVIAARASRPSIVFAAALLVYPGLLAAFWHYTGLVPASEGLPAAAVVAMGALVSYLTLALSAERLRRTRTRLAELELQAAAAAERGRIGRDLHDGLGAALAEIALWSEVAGAGGDPGAALERTGRRSRDALRLLRSCVQALDEGDEVDAPRAEARLRAELSSLAEAAGVRLELEVHGAPERLSCCRQEHLLRLLQEAVSNAIRHGRPARIEVQVGLAGPIRLRVRDDGCGFDPAAVTAGRGLGTMRDRARALGGELQIDSAPGAGTRLLVEAA